MINNGNAYVTQQIGDLDRFTVEQEIDGMLLYEYLLKSYQSDSFNGAFVRFSKILAVGPSRVRNTDSLTKACEYLEFRGHIRFFKETTPKAIELLNYCRILGNTSQNLRKGAKKKVANKRRNDNVNNVNMPNKNNPILQNAQWNNPPLQNAQWNNPPLQNAQWNNPPLQNAQWNNPYGNQNLIRGQI